MISTALIISVIVAAYALALAYWLGALWLPAVVLCALAAVWILGQRLNWEWLGWLMLVLFVGAAAFGALLDLSPIPLVIGMIAALSAWDLAAFAQQLRRADVIEHEQALKQQHLRRLLVVDGFGLLLAGLTLSVQTRLSFGLALVLGLVALVGLSRAIGFMRRESG